MGKSKSILNVAGIVLGGFGLLLCVAALVVLWMAGGRIGEVSAGVFERLDGAVLQVQQRVALTQERVQAAASTTGEVKKVLTEWSQGEARREIAERLDVDRKVDRIASGLQQANVWLEFAESAVGMVGEVISERTDGSEDAGDPSAKQLVEELAALRTQLAEVTDAVTKLRERIDAGDDATAAERIRDAAQISVRLAASIGGLDSRFASLNGRLSKVKSRVDELRSKSARWIWIATISASFLILLFAWGQVALCQLSWMGLKSASTE